MSNKFNLQGKKLVRQETQCPAGAQDIGIAVTEILEEGVGAVSKVVLEIGQPIKYWRYVDKNTLEEDDIDMMGMMGKTPIVEVAQLATDPFELLFHMITLPTTEVLVPCYWIVGDTDYLFDWLKIRDTWTRNLPTLINIPVRTADLPPDTIVIAGAQSADSGLRDVVKLWKAVMVERKDSEQSDRHALGGGAHSRGEPSTTRQVEDASRRMGGSGRRPTDLFRQGRPSR